MTLQEMQNHSTTDASASAAEESTPAVVEYYADGFRVYVGHPINPDCDNARSTRARLIARGFHVVDTPPPALAEAA